MNGRPHNFRQGGELRIVPLLAVMAAIFALSHIPGQRLVLPRFPGADKIAHGIAYGALAAAAIHASSPLVRRMHWLLHGAGVVFFCFLYGISDEFHQAFVPGRTVSGLDVLADTVGGLVVFLGWHWYRTRKGKHP